jgi:exonuclease SbcC
VLLTRLYLRNFRVYQDELDLELPPGLVGIYGPNGAGKSTLLEAVLWTLWGKARTTKEQIRSAGASGDCLTEVEFEHEGHLYLVRRRLTGINSMPRLEVRCDGLLMSEGVRDAGRYLESVLGMDDAAFRASVFAEQRQLSAFSDQAPSERQRLVLRLLGITPLDVARDAARRDARQTTADHNRLRGMLADLDALRVEAADVEARAAAAAVQADIEEQAARTALEAEQAVAAELGRLDRRRQEYDALVIEGRGARRELDSVNQLVTEQEAELEALTAAAARLALLEDAEAALGRAEGQLEPLALAAQAASALSACPVPPRPPTPDEAAMAAARAGASEGAQRLAALSGQLEAAADARRRAGLTAARSATLDGEADCPVCGQALGAAFEQVRAHRAAELGAAEEHHARLSAQVERARRQARDAEARLATSVAEADACHRSGLEWQARDDRRRAAQSALKEAWAQVVRVSPARATADGQPPAATQLETAVGELRDQIESARRTVTEADRLRVRLERRPALETSVATHRERAAHAAGQVQMLREKLRALAFEASALQRTAARHEEAVARYQAAGRRAREAAIAAGAENARHEAAAQRLADGEAQHARLAGLESQSRHLARVSDLLSAFRNTVVASVGPRLAAEAAQLFAELTDHEYDELQVDADTYTLQIRDGGKVYGLERFSGSEIDLANLALRAAISEHIHFQSGGSVGLLVLDEVFGPLDEDRKFRMLQALERLRGRFRQVLVVTHDATIKDQLPNAIEVVKLPGRRATARPVNAHGG